MFKPRFSRKGIILLYIFLFMLMISAMAAVFFDTHISDIRMFKDYENGKKAKWLAYGGISIGLQKLDMSPDFRGDMPDVSTPDGIIHVEIKNLPENKIRISATGIYQNVKIQAVKEIVTTKPLKTSK